jgi:hypothetical protein
VDFGAGLDGSRKSHPTRIRAPNRPGRSESLYRLRYSGRLTWHIVQENTKHAIVIFNTYCLYRRMSNLVCTYIMNIPDLCMNYCL